MGTRVLPAAVEITATNPHLPLFLGASAAAIATVAVVEPRSILLLGVLVGFVLSLLENEFFLLLFLLLQPMDAQLPGASLGDMTLAAHMLVATGFFVGRLWKGRLRAQQLWKPYVSRASLLLLGSVCLSVILGSNVRTDVHQAVRGIYLIVCYITFYAVLVAWLDRREKLEKVGIVVLGSTILAEFFGLYQSFSGGYTALWLRARSPDQIPWAGREPSFFSHANHFADFLILTLPFSIASLLLAKGRLWKRITVWATSLGVVALALTQSRGAFLAFGCVVIFVIIHFAKSPRVKLLLILGLALFAISAYLVGKQWSPAHLGVVKDTSGLQRLFLWFTLMTMFWHSPLWGVGFGTFFNLSSSYVPSWIGGQSGLGAHNIYFELLGETGLLGLGSFLLLLLVAARQARKLLHSSDWLEHALGFGIYSGILAIAIGDFFEHDILWEPQIGFLFWTWLAVLVAVSRLRAKATTAEFKTVNVAG